MPSIGQMIEKIDGLRGTKDLTDWEEGFVDGIVERYQSSGKDTSRLTGKQVEVVERIHNKHFG